MHYTDSLVYLNSFLNLERISYEPGRHWNLGRMRFLLKLFGHPEKSFFPVLIAGTKGKGSSGFFLESILKASRIPEGFYSSPHLEDPRERIRLGGRTVSKKDWAWGVEKIRRVLSRAPVPKRLGDFTYFEIMTLLAILLFQKKRVRIGIFEVGLGGRLDATNVLNPRLVILTPIHLDHEEILGPTIARIACQKAAIIRPGSQVVVSPQPRAAWREIRRRAQKQKARLWKSVWPVRQRVGLAGDYQKVNAGAALRACERLREYGFSIPEEAIGQGLKARNWPGRFELFGRSPRVLLDVAHNPVSMQALVRNLRQSFGRSQDRILIFGASRDKKTNIMLKTLHTYFDRVILLRASNPRAQELGTLLMQARQSFRSAFGVRSMDEAFRFARRLVSRNGLVVVTGSFYLAGEARMILRKRGGSPIA